MPKSLWKAVNYRQLRSLWEAACCRQSHALWEAARCRQSRASSLPHPLPLTLTLALLSASFLLTACSKPEPAAAGGGAPALGVQRVTPLAPQEAASAGPAADSSVAKAAPAIPEVRAPTLAYTHSVTLLVPEAEVAALAARTQAACRELPDSRCTVLSSAVHGGDYPGATLQLRATPADITTLKRGLAGAGEVVSDATSAEDLAEQMTDNAKRLDMLLAYRRELEQLRSRANHDIASLLQVQRELAQVQADIEQATGEKAYFLRRVNYEILNVEIASQAARSGLQPIREATEHFLENLATAAGTVISAIAFLLPWAALGTLVWWLARPVRRWWRARRGK